MSAIKVDCKSGEENVQRGSSRLCINDIQSLGRGSYILDQQWNVRDHDRSWLEADKETIGVQEMGKVVLTRSTLDSEVIFINQSTKSLV